MGISINFVEQALMVGVTIIYVATSVCIMIYGFHCYLMIALFLRRQKHCRLEIQREVGEFHDRYSAAKLPFATVQLPLYNESAVAERVLWSAARLDYPKDRYEIQVLDDSTDETRSLVEEAAKQIRDGGVEISVLHRVKRKGFKAGALAEGMQVARGEYLAIFDADFIIPKNFLKRSIALVHTDPKIACVQGRWGHINRKENWLTYAQSIGIDGHFTAEQGARSYNSLCMNFNGTAGIWRKQAIIAAGGWQADTLTEDLDLSYRVQLEGYEIRYDFDLVCPAEIPNSVVALKSQQKRWAKGSIETAKKLLPRIWRCVDLTLGQKIEATVHMTHYTVSILMVILCTLALPMLLLTPMPGWGWFLGILCIIIFASFMAPCAMYIGSGLVLGRGLPLLVHFPAMVVVGTGLCINNAWAIIQALRGKKSEFVRTPKSGSTEIEKKNTTYKIDDNLMLAILEIIVGCYGFLTFWVYLETAKYVYGFFICAYALGLTSFGLLTLKNRFYTDTGKLKTFRRIFN